MFRVRYFILFIFSFAAALSPQPDLNEQEKIQKLITFVERSGYTFIRNGAEYSSKDAASHMRLKLARAGDRVRTAEQFIEYLATRSSATGQPYMLKNSEGEKIPLAPWLRKKLSEMK